MTSPQGGLPPLTLAERVVDRVSQALHRRSPDRRSVLVTGAIVGSALATNPLTYLLRPGTAYASVCGDSAGCNDGYSAFCCTVNNGSNSCPPNSFTGGWWKVDNSPFCSGQARYIVDCNATCPTRCVCGCPGGTCDQRRSCCTQFRYGQCHTNIACSGPVVCRVALCTPPWVWDPSCTTSSRTDNNTRTHNAPCLTEPPKVPPSKDVFAFGDAVDAGSTAGHPLNFPIVGMAATPSGQGYWEVASDGGIFPFGDAGGYGSTGNIRLNKPIVGMARTPTGRGYWLVASDGGIFPFGDAGGYGSTGNIRLNQPIVGMAATPTGYGYWLVASDGGIFPFGDAGGYGSTGNIRLNKPIAGMAATPTGNGYWLVASDGGIFPFGDAPGIAALSANDLHDGAVVGMAGTPTGRGYWMAARRP